MIVTTATPKRRIRSFAHRYKTLHNFSVFFNSKMRRSMKKIAHLINNSINQVFERNSPVLFTYKYLLINFQKVFNVHFTFNRFFSIHPGSCCYPFTVEIIA